MRADKSMRLLSAYNYEELATIPRSSAGNTTVSLLCFNANGSRLATSAGIDHVVNVWDVVSEVKADVARLEHDLPVAAMVYHKADPNTLVTVTMTSEMYLWNVADTATLLFSVNAQLCPGSVPTALFTHDSTQLLICGERDQSGALAGGEGGADILKALVKGGLTTDPNFLQALDIVMAQGGLEASEHLDRFQELMFALSERNQGIEFPGPAVDANGDTNAGTGREGGGENIIQGHIHADAGDETFGYGIRSYNASTGQLTVTYELTAPDEIQQVVASPVNNDLVFGCSRGSLWIWNPSNPSQVRDLIGHEDMVRCMGFNNDGSKLATGSYDFTWKLWDLHKLNLLLSVNCRGRPMDCFFNPVRPDDVLISVDGKAMCVYDSKSGQETVVNTAVGRVCASPSGTILL
jgi:WD40 repeat protein